MWVMAEVYLLSLVSTGICKEGMRTEIVVGCRRACIEFDAQSSV